MNAIDRPTKINRASSEGIAVAASHEARQIRLAGKHFRRRNPVRPLGFLRNALYARPPETVAAHADTVADRLAATEHVVEIGIGCIDDDGSGHFASGELHHLAAQTRWNFTGALRLFGGSLDE